MSEKLVHPEVSAYAAGAVVGAAAMLLALAPHMGAGGRPGMARLSEAHVETLRAPMAGESLYMAAKVGVPPEIARR